MIDLDFTFTGQIWEWKGKGSWHFITLPEDISADIKSFTRHRKTSFGSVRVKVKIGETEWLTSLFPDKKRGAYLLPVKASARKTENINSGDCPLVMISVAV